jgi:hypothetical protein
MGVCATEGFGREDAAHYSECPTCRDDDPSTILSFRLVKQDTSNHAIAQQYEDESAYQFSQERGRHVFVLLLMCRLCYHQVR